MLADPRLLLGLRPAEPGDDGEEEEEETSRSNVGVDGRRERSAFFFCAGASRLLREVGDACIWECRKHRSAFGLLGFENGDRGNARA